MAQKTPIQPANFIVPLNMNGLRGRMMYLPPTNKKKRQMLLLYGTHSSLERMFALGQELNRYGGVTLVDLPGIGGMESFYKINQEPTIDAFADYLASFIKLRYNRRKVTILGFSLGFVIVTRMLQKYPELVKRVDLLVSVVGFVHHEDFKIKKRNLIALKTVSGVFSRRIPAFFAKNLAMRGPVIRMAYGLVADSHAKLKDADKKERRKRIDFEIHLWKSNDLRTYMVTGKAMLNLNLCSKQVDMPVHHIAVDNDQYFDNGVVEQHLGVIYSKVNVITTRLDAHMPTVVAEPKDVAPFIPPKLRRLLTKTP